MSHATHTCVTDSQFGPQHDKQTQKARQRSLAANSLWLYLLCAGCQWIVCPHAPETAHIPAVTCVAVCCSVLQCVAVCCSVFQCVAQFAAVASRWQQWRVCSEALKCPRTCCDMCCSVLQCFAVCFIVLHCVAVCCAVCRSRFALGNNGVSAHSQVRKCPRTCCDMCCSVLQYFAVCCSVLQCVAVCCSVSCVCLSVCLSVCLRPCI